MGANATEYGLKLRHRESASTANVTGEIQVGLNATKTLSAARVLFGAIFLFDGILKWILFEQGTMQATIQSFGISALSSNWVVVGALVGLGETLGGIALIVGLFQRPAALWCSAIMFGIWGFSGFDGAYVQGSGWSFVGYTDPGGDLMLALIFLVLVFAPYAYGLAPRLRLRERFASSSMKDRLLRFLVC